MKHIKTYELFDFFKKKEIRKFDLGKIDIHDIENYSQKDINQLIDFLLSTNESIILSFVNKLLNIYNAREDRFKNIEKILLSAKLKKYREIYRDKYEFYDDDEFRDLNIPDDIDDRELDDINKYNL